MNTLAHHPLKAIFCLNGPNAVNGPNVWLTRHLPRLVSRGIAPLVLYLSWDSTLPCVYRQRLEQHGIPIIPLTLGRFVEDNAAAIAKAASLLSPDVFIPNYSIAGYYAARFLRESGVRTVGTLHSDDPYYHDIIDYFITGPNHWRLSAVVGVSEYLRDLIAEKSGAIIPFLHAPYGVPIPTTKASWNPGQFQMIYAGRLVESQKRITRVLSAMEEATRYSQKIEGIVYGDGPERSRIELHNHRDNGRLRYGGLLHAETMQSALLEGQAFVLLSDFEGLSIALMEAMACGLVPVVTPMRSGVADLVEHGVTGFIVPPDKPVAFADRIVQLSRNQALWQRMSEAAREMIIQKGFTSDACADQWANFLKKICVNASPRQSLHLPPSDSWAMPPRSDRKDGIRLEDRRAAWPKMEEAYENGRPLFLWGASRAGQVFLEMIRHRTLPISGCVDSDPAKQGHKLQEIIIYSPEQFRSFVAHQPRPFVVITSQYESEIAAAIEAMGLKENYDYIVG